MQLSIKQKGVVKMNQELKDQAAKILCEIIDDNAPLGWEKYRGFVRCIVCNNDLMQILLKLSESENEIRD